MTSKFYAISWTDSSMEVVKASKLICLSEDKVGSEVLMKYKGKTWKFMIESIWGNDVICVDLLKLQYVSAG